LMSAERSESIVFKKKYHLTLQKRNIMSSSERLTYDLKREGIHEKSMEVLQCIRRTLLLIMTVLFWLYSFQFVNRSVEKNIELLTVINSPTTPPDSTASSKAVDNKEQGPFLFFLFMTQASWQLGNVWEFFFRHDFRQRTKTLLHCTDFKQCLKIQEANLYIEHVVQTVPSEHCTNLVNPMIQLLQEALKLSKSNDDRFIFISDSDLPLQSLDRTYEKLMPFRESKLCIRNEYGWSFHGDHLVIKASQWVLLNKTDAKKSVYSWPGAKKAEKQLFWKPIRDWSEITSKRRLRVRGGCLDEFYFSSIILGNFDVYKRKPKGSDIRATFCMAYVNWGGPFYSPQSKALMNAGTEFLITKSHTDGSPGTFNKTTKETFTILGNSKYLFARKFKQKLSDKDFEHVKNMLSD